MGNRLSEEHSLYLKQHEENAVDWWPWCGEAFEMARKENKLILISIGYSSCHWCHVMAHESFEDEYIADLMNRNFICIKVDREERPDVDQMFVEVVQMITGRAGWPLNVFCLPDGRPFFGGTYFPPRDIGRGIIPWPQLLMRLVEAYRKSPRELEENGDNIIQNLLIANNPTGEGDFPNNELLKGARMICATHDDEWGGFGGAPKFPSPTVLEYLFSVRASEACVQDKKLASRIDEVLVKTLKSMAHGGIYDQLGGGFSRYSVDRFWAVSHFEKMLYDNGLLLNVYTKGWLSYRLDLFKSIVEETIEWVEREMLMEFGAFASSLDADTEGVEGKFYAWTQAEVIEALGVKDGRLFCDAYGITKEGNFEKEASIPAWTYDDAEKRLELKPLKEKLLRIRELRKRPGRDTKILVSWNSLLAQGLVYSGFYFNRPEWVELGRRVIDWIWERMADKQGRLRAVYYYGQDAGLEGYLDDYAFYGEACLALASKIEWVAPGYSEYYIERTKKLVDVILEHFADTSGVGFFFTADDAEKLVARKKYWWDQAIASGNASMVHCLSDLYVLTGEMRYIEKLKQLRRGYSEFCKKAPNGVAYALAGFTEDAIGTVLLKISGKEDAGVVEKIQQYLASKPYRKVFILKQGEEISKKYQICVGTQCMESTNDLEAVLEKI